MHRNYVRPLRWRHNGRDSVSNHQPHHCLLSRLFRRRSKKTSKLRVTGLCVGNSPLTGEFPAQMASSAKNVSIWWRHHVLQYKDIPPKLIFKLKSRKVSSVDHAFLVVVSRGILHRARQCHCLALCKISIRLCNWEISHGQWDFARFWFNSLRPSNAIWRHRSGSTLAGVMACCLTVPSHYLNQYWLIISKVLWHSSEGNFIRDNSANIH